MISMNHWKWPSRMCFYGNSTHYICDLNHPPCANTAMPSMRDATSFSFLYNLFSNALISLVPAVCPSSTGPVFRSRCLILLSRSNMTGVMAESIFYYHCSRLGVLNINFLILSTCFLNDPTDLIWSWLIFFTVAMVVWSSAFMADFSDRALDFILYISYLALRSNEIPCLEICFSIMIPFHMVPTLSSLSSSLPPLPIVAWRFRTSPIKVSCYSQIRCFSSWSQWCYFCSQAILFPLPLSDIYYGAGSMKGTVQLVILTTSPFAIRIPSGNSIGVWWASDFRTWKISPHRPKVYDNTGRLSKFLTLHIVALLKTGQ